MRFNEKYDFLKTEWFQKMKKKHARFLRIDKKKRDNIAIILENEEMTKNEKDMKIIKLLQTLAGEKRQENEKKDQKVKQQRLNKNLSKCLTKKQKIVQKGSNTVKRKALPFQTVGENVKKPNLYQSGDMETASDSEGFEPTIKFEKSRNETGLRVGPSDMQYDWGMEEQVEEDSYLSDDIGSSSNNSYVAEYARMETAIDQFGIDNRMFLNEMLAERKQFILRITAAVEAHTTDLAERLDEMGRKLTNMLERREQLMNDQVKVTTEFGNFTNQHLQRIHEYVTDFTQQVAVNTESTKYQLENKEEEILSSEEISSKEQNEVVENNEMEEVLDEVAKKNDPNIVDDALKIEMEKENIETIEKTEKLIDEEKRQENLEKRKFCVIM